MRCPHTGQEYAEFIDVLLNIRIYLNSCKNSFYFYLVPMEHISWEAKVHCICNYRTETHVVVNWFSKLKISYFQYSLLINANLT